jgi:hypothetical protein
VKGYKMGGAKFRHGGWSDIPGLTARFKLKAAEADLFVDLCRSASTRQGVF